VQVTLKTALERHYILGAPPIEVCVVIALARLEMSIMSWDLESVAQNDIKAGTTGRILWLL
jgi:hypothetical protein